MKSYNHLYEQYDTDENYFLAVKNATRHKGGKKRKYRQARYYKNNAAKIRPQMMRHVKRFRNSIHEPKTIYDGVRRKQRQIVVPTMREQIIHHMVINVLKPIFLKSMYEHSYGSLPGRGPHLAKKRIEKWLKDGGKNCKYCLKMDIRKYFDTVPHKILKQKLKKLIHDERFLAVLFEIVDAAPGEKGIPIGFYTSQWFANWYLTDLDHYIKEKLGAVYYIRYMDDMVVFGPNKRKLHKMREEIETYLNEKLGLEMKDNWQVFLFDYVKKNGKRVGRDLDYMGFRFFRDKTILRRQLMLKATRKARKVCKKKGRKNIHDVRQALSYLGWIDATDTYNMYKKHVKPYVSFKACKRYVSRHQNIENRRLKESCGTKAATEA